MYLWCSFWNLLTVRHVIKKGQSSLILRFQANVFFSVEKKKQSFGLIQIYETTTVLEMIFIEIEEQTGQ